MNFFTVCLAEIKKLKRAKLTWITLCIMLLAAAALNGMLWVIRNPGLSAKLGLLGQKANLSFGGTQPDWDSLSAYLLEMTGIGGLLLASFILAWLFGREYQLGTAKVMLSLPLRRWWIVAAKALIALLWLSLLITLLWIGTGGLALLQGLPGFELSKIAAILPKASLLIFLAWGIALPVAWVAIKTKGVFAPLGYAFGTLLCATLFGNLGWGPYIPWSALEIYSGAGGKGLNLDPASWVLLGAAIVFGFGLCVHALQKTDNTQ